LIIPNPINLFFEGNQIRFAPNEIPLQGVLNFLDNYAEDGGFIVVPGFRNHFSEWFEATLTNLKDQNNKGKKEYTLEGMMEEMNSAYKFEHTDYLYQLAIRVTMRRGSIVIWDQRTPHGSTFNTSENFRCAQFVKMFPKNDLLSKKRALARSTALLKIIRRNLMEDDITLIGRRVFGLDWN